MSSEGGNMLSDELREYVHLQVDAFKLRLIEGLSSLIGVLLSFALILLIGGVALLLLLLLSVWLLSLCCGWFVAVAIVTMLLLAATALLYMNRKRMFADVMIGTLCQVFFEKKQADDTNDAPQ